MNLFHKNKHELPAISESDKRNNGPDVLATIDRLDIPRDMLIVVGGSALALLGLDRQAHDVDLALHPDVLKEIEKQMQLPNGVPVDYALDTSPAFHHFKADTLPLPVEAFPHDLGTIGGVPDFLRFAHERTIESDSGVLVVRPIDLYMRKRRSIRTSPDRLRKIALDRYDAGLLEKKLDEAPGQSTQS